MIYKSDQIKLKKVDFFVNFWQYSQSMLLHILLQSLYGLLIFVFIVYIANAFYVLIKNINILSKHGSHVLKYLLDGAFLWPIHLKNLGFRRYFAFYFQNKTPDEFQREQGIRSNKNGFFNNAVYWIYCSRTSDHQGFSLEVIPEEVRDIFPKNFNLIVMIGWIPAVGYRKFLSLSGIDVDDKQFKDKNMLNAQFDKLIDDQQFMDLNNCLQELANEKVILPDNILEDIVKFDKSQNKKSKDDIKLFYSHWYQRLHK